MRLNWRNEMIFFCAKWARNLCDDKRVICAIMIINEKLSEGKNWSIIEGLMEKFFFY